MASLVKMAVYAARVGAHVPILGMSWKREKNLSITLLAPETSMSQMWNSYDDKPRILAAAMRCASLLGAIGMVHLKMWENSVFYEDRVQVAVTSPADCFPEDGNGLSEAVTLTAFLLDMEEAGNPPPETVRDAWLRVLLLAETFLNDPMQTNTRMSFTPIADNLLPNMLPNSMPNSMPAPEKLPPPAVKISDEIEKMDLDALKQYAATIAAELAKNQKELRKYSGETDDESRIEAISNFQEKIQNLIRARKAFPQDKNRWPTFELYETMYLLPNEEYSLLLKSLISYLNVNPRPEISEDFKKEMIELFGSQEILDQLAPFAVQEEGPIKSQDVDQLRKTEKQSAMDLWLNKITQYDVATSDPGKRFQQYTQQKNKDNRSAQEAKEKAEKRAKKDAEEKQKKIEEENVYFLWLATWQKANENNTDWKKLMQGDTVRKLLVDLNPSRLLADSNYLTGVSAKGITTSERNALLFIMRVLTEKQSGKLPMKVYDQIQGTTPSSDKTSVVERDETLNLSEDQVPEVFKKYFREWKERPPMPLPPEPGAAPPLPPKIKPGPVPPPPEIKPGIAPPPPEIKPGIAPPPPKIIPPPPNIPPAGGPTDPKPQPSTKPGERAELFDLQTLQNAKSRLKPRRQQAEAASFLHANFVFDKLFMHQKKHLLSEAFPQLIDAAFTDDSMVLLGSSSGTMNASRQQRAFAKAVENTLNDRLQTRLSNVPQAQLMMTLPQRNGSPTMINVLAAIARSKI